MGSIGAPELIVIFVVALIVFGPKEASRVGQVIWAKDWPNFVRRPVN